MANREKKKKKRSSKTSTMAEEKISVPKFSGKEEDFSNWYMRAEAHAERFEFLEALSPMKETDLPVDEGPGATADEKDAVARNKKAAAFLVSAMPDSVLASIRAAGRADPKWPKRAKAHLMVQYLLESYQDQSTLAIVGAKRDLEGCTMKSYENPKGLFEKLTAVQVKYTGNPMVTISESDLVTQAIQALPAEYTSSVASLVDSGRALTIAELKKVVQLPFSRGEREEDCCAAKRD